MSKSVKRNDDRSARKAIHRAKPRRRPESEDTYYGRCANAAAVNRKPLAERPAGTEARS